MYDVFGNLLIFTKALLVITKVSVVVTKAPVASPAVIRQYKNHILIKLPNKYMKRWNYYMLH